MLYQPERARLQEASRIAHLEQRLGRLENVIGTGNEKLGRLNQVSLTDLRSEDRT